MEKKEEPKKYYTKSERERFKKLLEDEKRAKFGDAYKTKEQLEAEKKAKFGDAYKTKEQLEAEKQSKITIPQQNNQKVIIDKINKINNDIIKSRTLQENHEEQFNKMLETTITKMNNELSQEQNQKPVQVIIKKDKDIQQKPIQEKPVQVIIKKDRNVQHRPFQKDMKRVVQEKPIQQVVKSVEVIKPIEKPIQQVVKSVEVIKPIEKPIQQVVKSVEVIKPIEKPIQVIIKEDKVVDKPIQEYNSKQILENYQILKKELYDKHEALKKVFAGYRNLYIEARQCQDPKADIYWDKMTEVKELAEDCQRRMKETPLETPKIIEINQKYQSSPYADLRDIDVAYLRKHNELMNLYKAYNILANKIKEYKDKIDSFKTIEFKSVLTQDQLDQMIIDQRKAMISLSKIQDNLLEDGILDKNEMVNFTHTGPIKVEHFNHQLFSQLEKLGEKKIYDANNLNNINNDVLDQNTKDEIRKILKDTNLDPKQKVNKIIVLGKK
jgi:hypothetical protein